MLKKFDYLAKLQSNQNKKLMFYKAKMKLKMFEMLIRGIISLKLKNFNQY